MCARKYSEGKVTAERHGMTSQLYKSGYGYKFFIQVAQFEQSTEDSFNNSSQCDKFENKNMEM